MAVRSVATGSSSFTTFVQVLPRLASVVRHMRPTWHLPALASVTPEFLRAQGLTGLIWDVDGTLTGDRQPALAADAAAPFHALASAPGLRHVVLSNAGESRYRQLGAMFPGMPILRAYARGAQVRTRRLMGTDDSWTANELESRLAEGFVVVRKPHAALVAYAVRELERPPAEVVMIGDQYMTDIAGANLGGVRSIKLPTLAPTSFRPAVRLSQRLEAAVYAIVYGPPRRAA